MHAMTVTAGTRTSEQPRVARLARRTGLATLVVPVVLFAVALGVRLLAIATISFPLTEGSAYYVAVARNLAAGRGFEIDAIWSYATPPLVLPRPAFELWQPLASILAAGPMALAEAGPFAGSMFDSAQLGFALLGALVAPLAWLVARDAGRRVGLSPRRETTVAIGAGALVAVTGPLILPVAIPDSTLPFTVIGVAACLVMPAAAAGDRRAIVALGVLLALAYLTRMEAIWLGVAFVVLAVARASREPATALRRVVAVAGIGAMSAAPWWLRNAQTFGTPLPGQLSDNLFLTRNEQIFGYLDRPTLDGFLGQGAATIAANVATAAWHNTVDVLLVPAGAAVLVGLVTALVAAIRRGPAARAAVPGALGALLIAGVVTFAATTLIFPVATLWGTFEHAAGPLLVGLLVAGLLGADALIAALVRWRRWPRSNAWLAPLTLVLLTLPLTYLALAGAARQADAEQRAMAHISLAAPAALQQLAVDQSSPLISDRPIWLSDALARPVLALPDEPPEAILELATDFGARALVIVEGRGRHPAVLRSPAFAHCFSESSIAATEAPAAAVFAISPECLR